MADGVALEGAHLVVPTLEADLKPVLLVAVDHIDDLGFRDPLSRSGGLPCPRFRLPVCGSLAWAQRDGAAA